MKMAVSFNRRMVKLWYIYATENYAAVKRNKLLMCATTWMDLKGVMLSEKASLRRLHPSRVCSFFYKFLKFRSFNTPEIKL